SERNFQNAGGSSKGSQRLCGTEDVDQSTPDHTSLERRRDAGGAVGISDKLVADAGNDHALAPGEGDLTPRRTRPRRNHSLARAPGRGGGLAAVRRPRRYGSAGEESGVVFYLLEPPSVRLARRSDPPPARADENRKEKGEDRGGPRAPHRRRGGEKPPIGRLG